MSVLRIVVDAVDDWGPYYPSEDVISFEEYLKIDSVRSRERTRVINLCRSRKYLSQGYYCSLLAEARGQAVIPSIETLNNLRSRRLFSLQLDNIEHKIADAAREVLDGNRSQDEFSCLTYFGRSSEPSIQAIARELFERFPCPILRIHFKFRKRWEIVGLTPESPSALNDEQQTLFAEALEYHSHRVWRRPKQRRRYRFDLAILVDPDERFPPSDPVALKRFIRAGRKLGIAVELIRRADYARLQEYDALFIRETTAIDHHTYRFAKKAQAEGMVVIDDPDSILRCTNKVYLADLMRSQGIPAPKTHLLLRGQPREMLQRHVESLGYPLVLKIPDGSFSRGIIKVNDDEELRRGTAELFQNSAVVLAQEYLYTDFDWRIGVLDGRAIYACKYFMVRNHWQIYQHGQGRTQSGTFETLPLYEVPRPIIDAALRVTRELGTGLYGVDVKQCGERIAIIEVNDNPSIESGVEDLSLGDELYRLIMMNFLTRIEQIRRLS